MTPNPWNIWTENPAARWFTAPELAQAIAESEAIRQKQGVPKLELPGTNAVARRMLDDWLHEKNAGRWVEAD